MYCAYCSYVHSCRVVSYNKLNLGDYYTVSLDGVTRYLDGHEAEFVELNQWIKDFKHFHKLKKLKTFANFGLWKVFYSWRKNVMWR